MLTIGGDGTANEVAWGLLGSETALGLVPDGLRQRPRAHARASRCGRSARWTRWRARRRRRMDVGMINGRPFLNVAGAGFDAEVGADFHAHGLRGGRRGIFTYVRLSLLRTWSYRAEQWKLDAGEGGFEGRALVIAFVNGRQYGGGAIVAPGARLDDGLLDVVVIEDAPRFEIAWNATRLFLGGIEQFRRYRHLPAKTALLSAAAPFRAPPRRRAGGGRDPAGGDGAAAGARRSWCRRRRRTMPRGPFGPENA